jgi:hypothetical protein
MRTYFVTLVLSLGLLGPARAGLLALEVDPQSLGLRSEGTTLVDSLAYSAYWENGSPAFEFGAPASGQVTLSLTGSPLFVTGLGEATLRREVWPDDAPL